jgi:hypothetical protein
LRIDGKVLALPKSTGYQTEMYFVHTPVVPFNLAKGPSGPVLSSPMLCGACEGHNFTENRLTKLSSFFCEKSLRKNPDH